MSALSLTLLKFFGLLAVFAAVALAFQQLLNLFFTWHLANRAVNRRLKLLGRGAAREDLAALIRPDTVAAGSIHNRFLRKFYRTAGCAGIRIAPPRLAALLIAATVGLFVLLVAIAAGTGAGITPGVLVLLLAVAVSAGAGLPLLYISQRATRRTKRMEEQFPGAIDVFTRALRAGHPVASAISLLTTEMSDPMGSEFGIVADSIAYGADLNDALRDLADRWDSEDLRMFAVCVSVQSETGGNLAEILTNLSSVIRDRASLYLKVRALSSEGRMSAWMLSLMPVLTFLVLFLTNPGFYVDVAHDPIFVAVFTGLLGLYLLGVLWIRNMVNLKV